MERNLHGRVYINPNFKRFDTQSRETEPVKTTHFNRHYVEEMPSRLTNTKNNQLTSNNRRIFVNPNFINGNNAAQSITPTNAGYIKINENVNIVPNRQVLQKSKYLVQNIHQNCLQNVINNEQTNFMDRERNENNARKTSTESDRNTKESKSYTQEVPLTRSRYCIVRKKKRLSANEANKSTTVDLVTDRYPVPVESSNQLICYTNLYDLKNTEKKIVNYRTPEKITKIKITKYKIIPASYLKKNLIVEPNKNKSVDASLIKTYKKSNSKINSFTLITPNKNRFKFIKSSTPMKSYISPNISTIKTVSRVSQQLEKSILCNRSKLKIFKAKFKINNVPCRLFKKYGKCLRQDRGNCKYLHDKKHVTLCRKFLKGICHDKNCTLSHELTAKKMPTCHFYLKGMCTKEHCPYLHVKLSDKTKTCQEFAKGYCENGDKCQYRHDHNQIKKIEQPKTSKKLSTSSCRKRLQNKVTKSKQIKKKNVKSNDETGNSEELAQKDEGTCRYYKELDNGDVSYEMIKPVRCKLGTLPSFIQL